MAVIPIRVVPDPVLREKSRRVSNIDKSILKLIDDMIETVRAVPGRAGLAAPQIGVLLRVLVIQIPEEEALALINPEIVKKRGERVVMEGCLSIPGYQGKIKRANSVTVKGLSPQGKPVRIKATELLSQALEHEIDHLNGILYVDHLESGDDLYQIDAGDEEESNVSKL
ncbi:MAG: peptide deformylase [Dehalococcoidia bacterium]|nr:peptide deformylase [Dehalococcoidia bacterium]